VGESRGVLAGRERIAEKEARSGLPPEVDGTVLTVGTFDGVHRGHRAVLAELGRRARERGLKSVLVTFDRHPLTVVRPEEAPPLLTTTDEKLEILAQTAVDYVALLAFTRPLSLYRPEEFVRSVLLDRFRVRELVIGHDHGFGRSRSGGVETLRRLGRRHDFGVDVVSEVTSDDSSVSSTKIRHAVADGRLGRAARLLGRPYSLRSSIVRGEGRGRELGFPTANLEKPAPGKLLPPAGVYAVRASLRSEIREGLLHLGPRPTFPGSSPSIELHLLDFTREIYGETIRVEFLTRLREVREFPSVDELVAQMHRDRSEALAFFEGQKTEERS